MTWLVNPVLRVLAWDKWLAGRGNIIHDFGALQADESVLSYSNFNESSGMDSLRICWSWVVWIFFSIHIERKLQFILLDHKTVFRITDKNIKLLSHI